MISTFKIMFSFLFFIYLYFLSRPICVALLILFDSLWLHSLWHISSGNSRSQGWGSGCTSCFFICTSYLQGKRETLAWNGSMNGVQQRCSDFQKIANTGALCCVATGPHGAKSNTGGRDHSADCGEPHWWTNSSFSPPPLSIWNCRLRYDGLSHGSHGGPSHGSSLSSNSRGSRSRVGSDRYTNHHHSVSDDLLSYSGSPPDNFQAPRWTSPVEKFNFGEFATSSMGGSRSETPWFPRSTERQSAAGASATSHSSGSPSSLSESDQSESTSKLSFPNRTSSNRRSFILKPVYPLVFRNPVSDYETFGNANTRNIGILTPGKDRILPSHWPDNSSNVEHKFHKTLTKLPKLEKSPDPSASSRREGIRWSSASSYDLGFDRESFDIAEHIEVESLRSLNFSAGDKKCGVCGKLLWQKSPWSSCRIMRGGDMPTAGVLPCCHVFHAECLEQMTPRTHIHDPPCPLCLKTMEAAEESPSVSESLLVALRSMRRSRGVVRTDVLGEQSNEVSNHIKDSWRRNWPWAVPQWNSGSLIKNHLKKHFTFKGKISKDLFCTKVFRRTGSSSSGEPVQRQISF